MAYRPPNNMQRARMSVRAVGVALKGMDQKVEYSGSAMTLLISAHKNAGVLQLNTTGTAILGKAFDTKNKTEWGERLDLVAASLNDKEPHYFAIFRDPLDVVFITYIPDSANPKVKTVYATNKESVKEGITSLSDELVLEEINVDSPKELSYEKYKGKHEAPKPYTEQELARQEQDNAETAGGYGVLARIMNAQQGIHSNRDVMAGDAGAKPVALPGLGQIGSIKLRPAGKIKIPAKSNKAEPVKPKLKPIEKTKISKTGNKDPYKKRKASLQSQNDSSKMSLVGERSRSPSNVSRAAKNKSSSKISLPGDKPDPYGKSLERKAKPDPYGKSMPREKQKPDPYKKKSVSIPRLEQLDRSERQLQGRESENFPDPVVVIKPAIQETIEEIDDTAVIQHIKIDKSEPKPVEVEEDLLAPTEKATPYDSPAGKKRAPVPEPKPIEQEEEEDSEEESEEEEEDEKEIKQPVVQQKEPDPIMEEPAPMPAVDNEPLVQVQGKKKGGGLFGFISNLFRRNKKPKASEFGL